MKLKLKCANIFELIFRAVIFSDTCAMMNVKFAILYKWRTVAVQGDLKCIVTLCNGRITRITLVSPVTLCDTPGLF